jgi:hypothetical protein
MNITGANSNRDRREEYGKINHQRAGEIGGNPAIQFPENHPARSNGKAERLNMTDGSAPLLAVRAAQKIAQEFGWNREQIAPGMGRLFF